MFLDVNSLTRRGLDLNGHSIDELVDNRMVSHFNLFNNVRIAVDTMSSRHTSCITFSALLSGYGRQLQQSRALVSGQV